MTALLTLRLEPLLLLLLTIGAYLLGVTLQKRSGLALANPTLIAILVIGGALRLLHVSYAQYFSATQPINFLLGPATVALAIPMVRSIEHLRRGLLPAVAALCAGAITAMVSGYALVRVCGGGRVLALSMLPKSVTTPIAIGVAEQIGGVPSLSAVLAIAAGVLVAVVLPVSMRLLRVEDPSAVGLTAGTAGSGIATARVVPMGPVPAAFAGIALGANALLTALLAPTIAHWLSRW